MQNTYVLKEALLFCLNTCNVMNIFPDGKKENLGSFLPEHHYLSVFTSYKVILSVVSVCLLGYSEKLAVFWI